MKPPNTSGSKKLNTSNTPPELRKPNQTSKSTASDRKLQETEPPASTNDQKTRKQSAGEEVTSDPAASQCTTITTTHEYACNMKTVTSITTSTNTPITEHTREKQSTRVTQNTPAAVPTVPKHHHHRFSRHFPNKTQQQTRRVSVEE
jgi:hypothetical protein